MALNHQISTGSNTPIYKQIVEQVRSAVAGGDVAIGVKLPSVRALAEELLINPNTIAKAYAELIRDGIIESRKGRGVFVAKKKSIYSRGERNRRLTAAVDSFVSEALLLEFDEQQILDAVEKRLDQIRKRGQSA